jgi:hyperosmotically inducible protein
MTDSYRRFALVLIAVLLLPMLAAACGKTVGDTLDDATITTRVKTALLNDPDVGALRIDVNTSGGVVTLSGAVKSPAEADKAVQIAHTVKGVRQVKSDLQVSKQ